jgi:hypothetical protein
MPGNSCGALCKQKTVFADRPGIPRNNWKPAGLAAVQSLDEILQFLSPSAQHEDVLNSEKVPATVSAHAVEKYFPFFRPSLHKSLVRVTDDLLL